MSTTVTLTIPDNTVVIVVPPLAASTYSYLETLTYAQLEAFTYAQLESIL